MGNTGFSPPNGSNREVLARAAICQHVTCCRPEATTGMDSWKLQFVTGRCLSLLISRLFYTSQCPTQHLAMRMRQSSGTAAASQQVSGTEEELSLVFFTACHCSLSAKGASCSFLLLSLIKLSDYWKSNVASAQSLSVGHKEWLPSEMKRKYRQGRRWLPHLKPSQDTQVSVLLREVLLRFQWPTALIGSYLTVVLKEKHIAYFGRNFLKQKVSFLNADGEGVHNDNRVPFKRESVITGTILIEVVRELSHRYIFIWD